jgi:ribonuclease P/MRP protein subunit POP5
MVRIKHRYLLAKILYPSSSPSPPRPTAKIDDQNAHFLNFHAPTASHVTAGLILSHLRASIVTHFGDTSLGQVTGSLKIVYLSPATSTVIIRCARAHVRVVWAALTYINVIPGPTRGAKGTECVIQVVRVSGTVKKSEEELVRRGKSHIARFQDVDNSGID